MNRKNQALPYITYLTRDVIVIENQPYYRSTGTSSGLRGTWFPFIMIGGTKIHHKFDDGIKYPEELKHPLKEEIMDRFQQEFGLPIRDSSREPYYGLDPMFYMQHMKYKHDPKVAEQEEGMMLIKADSGAINSEAIDIDLDKINDILVKAGGEGAMSRICRKIDLINSLRLRDGIWNDDNIRSKALKLLSENEKSLANIPLQLDDKPQLSTDSPDEVNDWLISNGARLICELYELNELKKVEKLSTLNDSSLRTMFQDKKIEVKHEKDSNPAITRDHK